MEGTVENRSCLATVHLKHTGQGKGSKVVFEACRVGEVNESDGSIKLNWDLGELSYLRPSDLTKAVTEKLVKLVYGSNGKKGEAVRAAVNPDTGSCRLSLSPGAWLIHALDDQTYGEIEDILIPFPYYEKGEEGWSGPLYSADIWPKVVLQDKIVIDSDPEEDESEIFINGPKEPPRTEPGGKPAGPGDTQNRKVQGTSAPSGDVKTMDDTPVMGWSLSFLSFLMLGAGLWIILRRRIGKVNIPGKGGCLIDNGNIQKRSISGKLPFFLAGAVCLVIAVFFSIMASAQESDSSLTCAQLIEGEKRIIFENEAPGAPCLSVTKRVLNAKSGEKANAQDSFTFYLKIDGKIAKNKKMRLFSSEGKEFFNISASSGMLLTTEADEGTLTTPIRTASDGSFTLKAGERALFEDVQAGGLWEVREADHEDYVRVSPSAGDCLSGSIERKGSSAEFVNRYDPPDPGTGDKGSIEIEKKVLWPEGSSAPAQGSFRIQVLVDREPWDGKDVEIRSTGEQILLDTVKTNADGIFSMGADQTAFLDTLPLGADLEIKEIDDSTDLFVPTKDVSFKGSAEAGGKVVFTNRLASFCVNKRLEGQTSDKQFGFSLTNSEGGAMSGISYYLLDENGQLLSEDPQKTDENGRFSLKASTSAVFAGLPEGTVYSVLEEKTSGYQCVSPEEGAYSNLTVDGGIRTLVFENEKTDPAIKIPFLGGNGSSAILPCVCLALLLFIAYAGAGSAGRKGQAEYGKESRLLSWLLSRACGGQRDE